MRKFKWYYASGMPFGGFNDRVVTDRHNCSCSAFDVQYHCFSFAQTLLSCTFAEQIRGRGYSLSKV